MRMSFARALTTLALLAPSLSLAQAAPKSLINQPTNPLLNGFRWRAIGPVGPGGRVDDIAVDERNPSTYYIGFAVGGVLKTTNAGTTFESIFDDHASSIADIALAPSDPNVVYVATGEANNRQTTSYGDGLYKSVDAGKTFTNVGFKDAQTLGRIVVHPRDPNIAWIAVGGHLYGPNAERGVFMTTDGGKTWTKTLFVDDNTGATELVLDPSNPQTLWAAMYQRQRTAWGYVGGGPGSGIYQSSNGGRTWTKLTSNGLPRGTMGRVALDVCRKNPNTIYAQIEVAADKEPPITAAQAGRAAELPSSRAAGRASAPPNPQSSGIWRSNDKAKTWTFVSNENQRPLYFSQLRVDPNDCETLYVGGVGPTKSTDGGKTWQGLNNMGHVDNHAIWIDPTNSRHVMYGNDGGIDESHDAGATWEAIRPAPSGLAYHVSADMRRPYHVCVGLQDNGSWCGPSSVRNDELREGGLRQWMWTRVGGGDGFQNAMDPTDFNVFYTSSQNANIARYDFATGEMKNIKPTLGGGRGGAAGAGGEGGEGFGPAPARANIINPIPGATIQFNWNTPVILSPHNPRTLLLGGRSLFISRDRGDSWFMTKELGKGIDLSKRTLMGVSYALPSCSGRGGGAGNGVACILSKGDGYGANEFGTMTEVAESPVLPGVIWAGTDDGNVQVSKDGGATWEEVGKNVPGVNHEFYVSGLEASWYDAGTAYLAVDGHRNDDLKPYIFKTTDYGKTWVSIVGHPEASPSHPERSEGSAVGALPSFGNVNAIRQDPVNRNLLYAATEMGFFVSLDDGKSWDRFMANLPIGRVDEVLVHPRDHDLVLATHSRSVWVLDDATALEALTPQVLAKDAALLPTRDAVAWKSDRRLSPAITADKVWKGDNAPHGTAISWYLKSGGGPTTVTISDAVSNEPIRTQSVTSTAGLNRWQWDLCSTPTRPAAAPPDFRNGSIGGGFTCAGGGRSAAPGTYRVSVSVAGREIGSQTFRVLEDAWLNER
jgi:photosystem II stability/assembly factor-like uncharacterized protein